MKTHINPAIEPIVREFKAALQALYGDRLGDVVLYGSYQKYKTSPGGVYREARKEGLLLGKNR